MADVVVAGSCNMDLIAYAPTLPLEGETIQGTRFETGFGGKGANQCVMASKLGAKTAMIGKLGNDELGKQFMENFNRLGVNTDYLSMTDKAGTGVAPITVGEDGKNSIIIVPGANLCLTNQDVDSAISVIKSAKLLEFYALCLFCEAFNVLVCLYLQVILTQLEISPETTLHSLKVAKSLGLTTIFNPAPAPKEKLNKKFYEYSDIFCPNETEATSLSEIKVVDVESAKKAALYFLDMGCKISIITLGKEGCVFAEQNDRTPRLVPCNKVNVVDTTGAGDCFAGSLAYFIAKLPQCSLEEKIRRACYIASVSVGRKGTQSSYPTKDQLPPELFA